VEYDIVWSDYDSGSLNQLIANAEKRNYIKSVLACSPLTERLAKYVGRKAVKKSKNVDPMKGIGLKKRISVSSIMRPAVYFLYAGDEVVYIGQSTRPNQRIDTHVREAVKTFDSYRIIPCKKERLLHWEGKLINWFAPKYNKTHCCR